jgi:hypothetical protein
MEDRIVSAGTKVKHPQFGIGKVEHVAEYHYVVNFDSRGIVDVSKKFAGLEILGPKHVEDEDMDMDTDELEKAVERVLRKWNGIGEVVPLGDRWSGGTLLLQPADPAQKPKEIPIETFFHKIVMLRDRLRVLEQNINSQEKLSDEDKVNLQQYITRIYGSLTTFNVLFKNKEQQFVGEKGKE